MFYLVTIILLTSSVFGAKLPCEPTQGSSSRWEILDFLNCSVWSIEDDEFTEDDFDAFEPGTPFSKKDDPERYIEANSSCIYASPTHSEIYTSALQAGEGKKWTYRAQLCPGTRGMGGCVPNMCDGMDPYKESLKFTWIAECQILRYDSHRYIHEIVDPTGSRYILHTHKHREFDPNTLSIPKDWDYRKVWNTRNITLLPHKASSMGEITAAYPNYPCGFVLARDVNENAFYRYVFSGVLPPISMIAGGKTPAEILRNITTFFVAMVILIIVGVCACAFYNRMSTKRKKKN